MNPSASRQALLAEHERLDALFADVLARLKHDDREETAAAWNDFERGLLAHMALEESDILPGFSTDHPAEAAAILADHEHFRGRLAELGVAVDLHFIRADIAADFIDRLRAHAKREDALMYQWADAQLHAPEL